MDFESRLAESSATIKINNIDTNYAEMENLSDGTRMTSDAVPSNVHEGFHNVTILKKMTSKNATVTSLEKQKFSLNRQIDAFKEERKSDLSR